MIITVNLVIVVLTLFVLYADDPLWDGKNWYPKMPWFFKALNDITSDDIELRVCSDFGLHDEGTPLDIIELYVK